MYGICLVNYMVYANCMIFPPLYMWIAYAVSVFGPCDLHRFKLQVHTQTTYCCFQSMKTACSLYMFLVQRPLEIWLSAIRSMVSV